MQLCDWQIGVILVITANGRPTSKCRQFFFFLNVTVFRTRFDSNSSEFRFCHRVDFRGRSYSCDPLQLECIQHEGWYRPPRHPRTIWNAIIQAR